MAEATSSVEGVLTYFLMPILPKIDREPTRERLIGLHRLIRGDEVFVVSNLRGRQHGHLALTMISKEYRAKIGFAFVPPHNLGDYPKILGNVQEQALRNEKL